MKKILLTIVSAAALLSGCDEVEARKDPEAEKIGREYLGTLGGVCYSLVELDGHKYLSAYGVRCVSLVHAESCPCKGAAAKPGPSAPVQ